MLYELLYTSAATRSMSVDDLERLLRECRRANTAAGTTGLLAYHDQSFMQILEGEEHLVKRLYDKIALDERHTAVRVFWEGPIEQRGFGDWSMAFARLDELDESKLEGFSTFLEGGLDSPVWGDMPSAGQELLVSLRDTL